MPKLKTFKPCWIPDRLPPREQAIQSFFGSNPAKVVELLEPAGTNSDAESLFLLAFAHDDPLVEVVTLGAAVRERHAPR